MVGTQPLLFIRKINWNNIRCDRLPYIQLAPFAQQLKKKFNVQNISFCPVSCPMSYSVGLFYPRGTLRVLKLGFLLESFSILNLEV